MRFLVVGCGSIGERHVRNLISLGERDILVHDSDRKRMEEIRRKYGVDVRRELGPSLDEVDALLVCTPPVTHVPLAKMALDAGLNVFVEKPLSHTMDGVDEIVKTAKRRGLVLAVGYNFRFHPGMRKVKEKLESGLIGRVMWGRAIVGQYLPDWRPWQDYRKSYTARREMGGGIILDGSHELDYMRWLMGEVNSVLCFAGKLSSLEVNVEDSADILMRHEGGRVSNVHMDFIRRDYFRVCEIVGEEGTVRWSFPSGTAELYSARTKRWRMVYAGCDPNEMYVREMRCFIRCIQGKEAPLVDGEEGRKTLEVALAAKKSAASGRTVKVG
jgi:predicted dehydrogenase